MILKLDQQYKDVFQINGTDQVLQYNYFSNFFEIEVDLDFGTKIKGKIKTSLNSNDQNALHSNPNMILKDVFLESGYNSYTPIFTNGSYIPNKGVGCGIFSESGDIKESYHLFNLMNIFDAEAIAISHALRLIFEKNIRKAAIITDSLSVLSALLSLSPPGRVHQLIANIREMLLSMNEEGFLVKLLWSPSNVGIEGNDRVDELAKQGATNTGMPGVHAQFIFPTIYFLYSDKRRKRNHNGKFGTRPFLKDIDILTKLKKNFLPWFYKRKNLNRSTITLISRLRSHHVNLATHRHQKNISMDPNCQCGNRETIQHFFECPNKDTESIKLFTRIAKVYSTPTTDVIEIAFGDNTEAWSLLEQFVRRTKSTI